MRQLPHTRSCFVCGEANRLGLNIRFQTNGEIVEAHFTPRAEHAGFQSVVHGGITATLLDEIMVWACAIRTGRFGYCAEMSVRYLHPIRPGEEVIVRGELVENRRNKIFEAKGEIRNAANEPLATSTGKYFPLKDSEIPALFGELIGDTTGLIGLPKSPSKSGAT